MNQLNLKVGDLVLVPSPLIIVDELQWLASVSEITSDGCYAELLTGPPGSLLGIPYSFPFHRVVPLPNCDKEKIEMLKHLYK